MATKKPAKRKKLSVRKRQVTALRPSDFIAVPRGSRR